MWHFEGPWRGTPGQCLSDQIRRQRGWQPFRSISKDEKQRSLSETTTTRATTTAKTIFRVRFFKKIQDWILKSERIYISKMDSSVPLMHHDPRDLGLICLVKKRTIRFRILSDLRIQSRISLKKPFIR